MRPSSFSSSVTRRVESLVFVAMLCGLAFTFVSNGVVVDETVVAEAASMTHNVPDQMAP